MTPELGPPATPPILLRLYRVAATSVLLFVVIGMILPPLILNSVEYDTELAGQALVEFIGAHRMWWMWLQTLTMGSMIFTVVPFAALFFALKDVDALWAGIGTGFAIICQILFMAYFPVVNGLVWVSDRYHETADPVYRDALIGGAEALVAQNNVYGTSDGIFALSLIVISFVMLKSRFAKWIGWLGAVSGAAGIVAAFFKPVLGIHYLWWWSSFTIWFLAIGWQFYRLGWPQARAEETPGR